MIPTLGQRLGAVPAQTKTDPETERYLLYGAVADLLTAASALQPTVLVLDDLQWSDGQTSDSCVMSSPPWSRLGCSCSARFEPQLWPSNPLLELLGALQHEPGVSRIELKGFDDTGVLAFMEAAQRCADGTTKSLNYTSYGKAEGWAIPQQVTCKLTDGQLWFPTRKGLAIVEPANLSTNSQPPPVLIEELIVDGEAVEQVSLRSAVDGTGVVSESVHGRPLRLPPGTRRLEFRYTGLDFTAPDKVRFKYKLAGLEDDWVDAGDRHSVQYNYLPPGAYHFHVIACNHQDVWNERGASLTFTVLPYFWQKWWFRGLEYLGGAAGVGGVAFLVSRRRHRRLVEHLERQHALEHERARVAKDIHDDLGASLTQIMMLSQPAASEIEQPKLAAALLDRIYLTARETTRAMDEIVWAINPKHDSLDGLATYLHGFVEAFAGSAGLHCRLDVPVQLPACPLDAEKRHNLFLAFKEALHNVVKHSGASEVKVSLTVQTAAILLKVEDNGCGFPASNTPPERRKGGRLSGGNGLENMRRRMEGIGGHCEIQSAPGQGTKVTFVTPTGSRDQR